MLDQKGTQHHIPCAGCNPYYYAELRAGKANKAPDTQLDKSAPSLPTRDYGACWEAGQTDEAIRMVAKSIRTLMQSECEHQRTGSSLKTLRTVLHGMDLRQQISEHTEERLFARVWEELVTEHSGGYFTDLLGEPCEQFQRALKCFDLKCAATALKQMKANYVFFGDSTDAILLLAEARLDLSKGDPIEAYKKIRHIAVSGTAFPDDIRSLSQLWAAQLARMNGQLAPAKNHSLLARGHTSGDLSIIGGAAVDLLLIEGEQFLDDNRYSEAQECFNQAVGVGDEHGPLPSTTPGHLNYFIVAQFGLLICVQNLLKTETSDERTRRFRDEQTIHAESLRDALNQVSLTLHPEYPKWLLEIFNTGIDMSSMPQGINITTYNTLIEAERYRLDLILNGGDGEPNTYGG